MPISPIFQFDTSPPAHILALDDQKNPIPLTGATFQAILQDIHSKQDTILTGTYVITDAINGKFDYYWDATGNDTKTKGDYQFRVQITIAGRTQTIGPVPLTIK